MELIINIVDIIENVSLLMVLIFLVECLPVSISFCVA